MLKKNYSIIFDLIFLIGRQFFSDELESFVVAVSIALKLELFCFANLLPMSIIASAHFNNKVGKLWPLNFL